MVLSYGNLQGTYHAAFRGSFGVVPPLLRLPTCPDARGTSRNSRHLLVLHLTFQRPCLWSAAAASLRRLPWDAVPPPGYRGVICPAQGS